MIAYGVSAVIYINVGAKKGFIVSFAISAVGGIAILMYEKLTNFFDSEFRSTDDVFFIAFLVCVAKFGTSSALNIGFICTYDVFPVLFSATGCGICNFFARGLTLFAPMIAEIQSLVPMLIFTSLCLLSLICSFFLDIKEGNK